MLIVHKIRKLPLLAW